MEGLDVVKKVIRDAGKKVMSFYGADVEVSYKDSSSPVTRADLVSEKVILDGLESFGYGILSEESVDDLERLKAERVWVVDPLDGTKDFINKTGEFSIMIGLVERGEVVLGCVFAPALGRLYYAERGIGAFLELEDGSQEKLRVSRVRDHSKVRMLVSRFHLLDLERDFSLSMGINNMIECGSAGLKMCKIAEGSADLYLNTSDKTYEWDVCAADLILNEAGGAIVTMRGNDIAYNKENPRNLDGFVASNGLLNDEVISFRRNY